jgi:amino acid adenylation domain-containing protein
MKVSTTDNPARSSTLTPNVPDASSRLFCLGSVYHRFSAMVDRFPHAVAVEWYEGSIDYRELKEKSDRLAACLSQRGIVAGDLVGVYLPQGVEAIVSFVAIVKLGAAYVPLAADYPAERLAFIIADANVAAVIADSRLDRLSLGGFDRIVDLDAAMADDGCLSVVAAEEVVDRDWLSAPIYVIYTSGSTGQPKGVVVCQRGVLNLVIDANYIDIKPEDKIGQVSNLAFDAATFEIWGALLNGGCLCIIKKEVLLDSKRLYIELRNRRIDSLFVTTALFDRLSQIEPEIFATLKYLLFGGEAVNIDAVRRITTAGKPRHLLHVYGPTENTTFSTFYEITSLGDNDRTIPIGKTLPGVGLRVLNELLVDVAIAEVGELYLTGCSLAIGYLNRPEINNDRFVFLPGDSSQRWYKTGDLVKILDDGNIEFVGRTDRQVKIRGLRIELEEIELAFQRHTAVNKAFVTVGKVTDDRKQLMACIQSDDKRLTTRELQKFLQPVLPPWAIPNQIKILSQFPLTPNGKIDWRALLKDDPAENENLTDADVSQNELENRLRTSWMKALGVKTIDLDDNFFDCGGDSLLVMQLCETIRQETGKQISPTTVYQNPTIREMAIVLQDPSFADRKVVLANPGNSDIPRLFWCVQTGFSRDLFVKYIDSEQPLYCIDLGVESIENPREHIANWAQECWAEIQSIQPEEPYYLGGLCLGGLLALEIANLIEESGKKVLFLGLLETRLNHHLLSPQHSLLYDFILLCEHVEYTIDLHHRRMQELSIPEKIAYIGKRTIGRIGRRTKPSEIERTDTSRKLAQQAFDAYLPKRRFSGVVDLFVSARYTRINPGWDRVLLHPPNWHISSGGHFACVGEPGVGNFTKRLIQLIRERSSTQPK